MTVHSPSRQIDWSDLFPWTIIFRALSPACSVTVIGLALVGVLATSMGWLASETLFLGSEELKNQSPLLTEIAELNRSPYQGIFKATQKGSDQVNLLGVGLSGPRLVFQQITRPFYAIFGGSTTVREFLYFAVGGIWSIAVWSFIGLGIARMSLLRLTRNEAAGLDDAFDYSTDFFKTAFTALSLPMIGALVLCIPTGLLGLLMGADFGAMLIGFVWFVVLADSLIIGILLLGLLAGWPLIVASIAAEGQNALDAVTRAYAYVFQRPVHYLFYCLVAVVFGGIVWLVAFHFTESVIRLSFWSTGWGANSIQENRIDEIKGAPTPFCSGMFSSNSSINQSMISSFQAQGYDQVAEDPNLANVADGNLQGTEASLNTGNPSSTEYENALGQGPGVVVPGTQPSTELAPLSPENPESKMLLNARRFIFFWIGFAKTIAAAFIHGLFWCMSSAVYLLLRKEVDETEMDEIFVIEEKRSYDLPPLQSDEHGIPQIQPLPLDDLKAAAEGSEPEG